MLQQLILSTKNTGIVQVVAAIAAIQVVAVAFANVDIGFLDSQKSRKLINYYQIRIKE